MTSYEISAEHCTFRCTPEGERLQLSNFAAKIIQETRFVDENKVIETRLLISGTMNGSDPETPTILPPVEITSDEFAQMGWVLRNWGSAPLILPGQSSKDHLRAAVQILSPSPVIKTIHRNIGWLKGQDEKPVYLHAKGGITETGNDPNYLVALPPELTLYDLSNAPVPAKGLQATLNLLDVGPLRLTWPLLAGTLAPLYTNVDFAIHLTGRTGTFKSELLSLFLSHFGANFDARHMPGSWSSTGNALEAQAHAAKNAPFVIDDFVPNGTSWQMKAYQTTADKIIRAQGNQAGRARLNETSTLQRTLYPRGIVLSTGEDTPEGHSVRGRMLILEISPDDVTPQRLTICQKMRSLFKGTTVAAIQKLIKHPPQILKRAQQIRDKSLNIGHTRTPAMMGILQAVAEQFTQLLVDHNVVTATTKKILDKDAWNAISAAGAMQNDFLEQADPVEQFLIAFRNALGQKFGHLRRLNGGVPKSPDMLGWTGDNGTPPMYKSHGPCIGWIDWEGAEIFVDANAGWQTIKKAAGNEMSMTKQTLTKRLKEAGAITRVDDARQRNTVRITAEDHPRLVIALSLPIALNTQEIPK